MLCVQQPLCGRCVDVCARDLASASASVTGAKACAACKASVQLCASTALLAIATAVHHLHAVGVSYPDPLRPAGAQGLSGPNYSADSRVGAEETENLLLRSQLMSMYFQVQLLRAVLGARSAGGGGGCVCWGPTALSVAAIQLLPQCLSCTV